MDSSRQIPSSQIAPAQVTRAQISVLNAARAWWKYAASVEGKFRATRRLLGVLWEFVRDSTPDRRRSRFGDAGYDWDYRVNTTSGAVGWRDRLLGMFHSAYQPTEPAAFHEMLDAIRDRHVAFQEYTFIDLGSGKGRTLLMASDYPFRRIVGVELLPALHQVAEENLRKYKSDSQKGFALESICADATTFSFPEAPLVLYLFNPFPDSGLRRVLANLKQSLDAHPRPVYVLYHNPLMEHVLSECASLRRISTSQQFSLWQFGEAQS
jgi:SAM-dependent methyltransferase